MAPSFESYVPRLRPVFLETNLYLPPTLIIVSLMNCLNVFILCYQIFLSVVYTTTAMRCIFLAIHNTNHSFHLRFLISLLVSFYSHLEALEPERAPLALEELLETFGSTARL